MSTLGKNYPEVLTLKWLEESKHDNISRIQYFLDQSIEKIERKKCSMVLKILEEWLKNYQNISQAEYNDERVIKEYIEPSLVMNKLITPYSNPKFCEFIYFLIDNYMLSQPLTEEVQFYQGSKLIKQ